MLTIKRGIIHIAVWVLACAVFSGPAFAGGVVIITNKSIPAGAVDIETVKKIYSGHVTKLNNNQTLVVTVMEGADIHKEFLKEYVNKTEAQFKTTWKKMVFTGEAPYPKVFKDMQSLIDFVSKTNGAIGYVDTSVKTEGVNVVK
jgi:ABC-type phosphate transport system substrate-binding protein